MYLIKLIFKLSYSNIVKYKIVIIKKVIKKIPALKN